MTAYNEKCAICFKDISKEMPNDWDAYLCESCARKEHFKRRDSKLDDKQKTLFG